MPLNISDFRALTASDSPPYTEITVPHLGGQSVRIRRLSAVGYLDIIDLWAQCPKDADGNGDATAPVLAQFYERLIADTIVDESNIPLFANADDLALLRTKPAILIFLGQESQKFNADSLAVKKVDPEKNEAPAETSHLSSAENSK